MHRKVGGGRINNLSLCVTSHSLAKELLRKPDGFIAAKDDESNEYIITGLRKVSTHANIDDTCMYWELELEKDEGGNIKKNANQKRKGKN